MRLDKKKLVAVAGIAATAAAAYFGGPGAAGIVNRAVNSGEDDHTAMLRVLRIICQNTAKSESAMTACAQ